MKGKRDIKEVKRAARHERIRKRVVGLPHRPRLCLHRSLKNIYAQMVDDTTGKVLFGLSTLNKEVRQKIKSGGNIEAASVLGETVASIGLEKGITKVTPFYFYLLFIHTMQFSTILMNFFFDSDVPERIPNFTARVRP